VNSTDRYPIARLNVPGREFIDPKSLNTRLDRGGDITEKYAASVLRSHHSDGRLDLFPVLFQDYLGEWTEWGGSHHCNYSKSRQNAQTLTGGGQPQSRQKTQRPFKEGVDFGGQPCQARVGLRLRESQWRLCTHTPTGLSAPVLQKRNQVRLPDAGTIAHRRIHALNARRIRRQGRRESIMTAT
jgi:hypothetical protein